MYRKDAKKILHGIRQINQNEYKRIQEWDTKKKRKRT